MLFFPFCMLHSLSEVFLRKRLAKIQKQLYKLKKERKSIQESLEEIARINAKP